MKTAKQIQIREKLQASKSITYQNGEKLAMISCDGTELEHRQITQSALKLVASS
jgi:hypothetical protein